VAIDRINKLLGINVPTEQLLADATKIQEELSKLEEALKSEEEKEKRSKGGLYV
jgi:predicted ATP-grasp superfamily ATP-dependent carboligase